MENNTAGMEDIVEGVRLLARKHPDAVYTMPENQEGETIGCAYTRGKVIDGPQSEGCVIGQVLLGLHYNPDDLDSYDEFGNWMGVGPAVSGLVTDLGLTDEEDDPNFMWLVCVQMKQDNGTPWGIAVKEADGLLDRGELRDWYFSHA